MSKPANWRQETDAQGIVWLGLDKADSSANVLSGEVLQEFDILLKAYEQRPPHGLVIYSNKSSGFIMGADINEFKTISTADEGFMLIRLGQELFSRLEHLRCPTVAVLNGFALGGGLELALACRYRLALDNDKPVIGLPEVQLGLHPGFGGTVRAVRMAGVRAAMNLMLTGKPIRVRKALSQGFVDRVVAPDNWRHAAAELLASGTAKKTAALLDKLLNWAPIRPVVARTLRQQVAARARKDHYPAPYAIIDLWTRHGASEDSYEAEARSFADLMVGETSRNLVRVFFLQNRLKSQGRKPASRIERVHVVGAGVMGGDIAAWCALRGLTVTLQDRADEYVMPAMERAQKLFAKRIHAADQRKAAEQRLSADVAGVGVAQADLIIEAIFENTEAKQALYQTIQAKMKDDAVLATNTSSIRLEELRTVLDQPQRFIGLHFFNPVAKLPLVELIRCDDTDEDVLDAGFAFVKALGKFPLECRSAPGFVVNRVLAPYMAEAMYLADAGVPLAAIDRAAEDFGMPVGPIELIDTVGLDVAMHVSKVLSEAFDRDVPDTLQERVERKDLGRKTGRGFYEWQDGKAVKPEIGAASIPPDMTDRLILPMVNEAVSCLNDDVVRDADLLDAGVIFGTGFAPFRGGPLKYARDRGPADIIATLERFTRQQREHHGERFAPSPGWGRIQASGD